ncbi:hypothetical protein [Kibdelosporangium aridum]|uniref:hypothetical protein n=1 Tax=Kibdelosporangium aridum TaxID=2030 RepID=UPI000525A7A7
MTALGAVTVLVFVACDRRGWPEPRKKPPPRLSKLDLFKPVIDGVLRADLDVPRKQRHTVKRIFDRLIAEHAMVDVSYQVVRAYVAVRKLEIRTEAGHGPVEVFVPHHIGPGWKPRSTSVR